MTAGIPEFDPTAPHGPLYRLLVSVLSTRAGRQLGIRVASRVDPPLLKATGGRLGLGLVLPSAALTTTGAKSGAARTVAVLYFTDQGDPILIASSFGRDHHPAWYHNLKANPSVELERGGRSARYAATEVTDEAERERLYALATKVYGPYADYKTETEAIGRRIPIVRLTLAA